MKEKLEWLKLLVPGLVLTGLIGSSIMGNGPKLQKIPEKLVAEKATMVPATTSIPELADTRAKKKKEKTKKLAYKEPGSGYQDGTYQGSATGYGGPIQVEVTVKDKKITSVSIVAADQETPDFLEKAKAVAGKIVSAQSPNVDVVSGATYSSNGIINAVIAALKQAGATDLKTRQSTAQKKSSHVTETVQKTSQKKPSVSQTYEDGNYEGSGTGYGGTIKVRVEIKKGKLKTVSIVSAEKETPSFLDQAKVLLTRMVKEQTSQVDVVSGATYSSNGIKEAATNALEKAKKKGASPTAKPEKKKKKDTESKEVPQKDSTDSNSTQEEVVPTPVPVVTPGLEVKEETNEDGSTVVETKTTVEKQLVGQAVCYPDASEDFTQYPVSITVKLIGETVQRTTTVNGVQSVEENTTYQLAGLSLTEEAKNEATKGGNWLFLNQAANGNKKSAGVFNQLLTGKTVDQVDAVSGATCSANALTEAYKNAMEQIKP